MYGVYTQCQPAQCYSYTSASGQLTYQCDNFNMSHNYHVTCLLSPTLSSSQ